MSGGGRWAARTAEMMFADGEHGVARAQRRSPGIWIADEPAVGDESVRVRPGRQIHDDPPVPIDAPQKVGPWVPVVETANESHRPRNPRRITEQDRVHI